MKLTNRDLDIFKLISKTAILTTAQIERVVFKGVATTTVLRRLRKLEKTKFIERIEGLPNHELAWALTLKGAESVGYINPKRHFHRLNLVHDVKLADLQLVFQEAKISQSWIPEHEVRSTMAKKYGVKRMQNQSVPDGIMSVSYDDMMESVVIEMELHYKNRDRYRQIFQSYIGRGNVKAVWYFVPSESLGRHLEKLWAKSVGKYGPWFFWSLVDDVLQKGGLAEIRHFDKTFVIQNLFEPTSPAHTVGSGVSNLNEEKTENQNGLTNEIQSELPAKVS